MATDRMPGWERQIWGRRLRVLVAPLPEVRGHPSHLHQGPCRYEYEVQGYGTWPGKLLYRCTYVCMYMYEVRT